MRTWITSWLCLLAASVAAAADSQPYVIEVVDAATGRGVPLVELETTTGRTYLTDSAGLVVFQEPGLMNQEVWFQVQSHGYEVPADGFGARGVRLQTAPGTTGKVAIKRVNIAERVCRLSGAGIYRDSVLSGRLSESDGFSLRAKITGYDSVQMAVYQDRLYWFWGDTNRVAYPLGNFHMTGATTALPTAEQRQEHPYQLPTANGVLRNGLDYRYWTDDTGFARGVCRMDGDGPTWLDALTVLRDADGREVMYGAYVKVRPPLSVYRRGICRWVDAREEFEHVADMPLQAPLMPYGHPQLLTIDDEPCVVFGDPFPNVSVPATEAAFLDLKRYRGFTPLVPGTTWADRRIERDSAGNVVYGWKPETPPLTPSEERDAVASGLLSREQARWQLHPVEKPQEFVEAHRGSVKWNAYRNRWVLITTQVRGTSMLGEVWYAEATAPTGPWGPAVKVVTHDKYSYYNPLQHHHHDAAGGRYIHFEGTYTHTFSGTARRTPDYDYNQMLYRLDLSDPRLRVADTN